MSTAAVLSADSQPPPRPRPLGSLTASARRLATKKLGNRNFSIGSSWQEDAWEMYDLVGEQRFLATTLAGRLSQARLYVGKLPDNAEDDPIPVTDPALTSVLDAFGDGAPGRSQILNRTSLNLFITGECWLAGIPKSLLGEIESDEGHIESVTGVALEDLTWRMLSVSEVESDRTGRVKLTLDDGVTLHVTPDQVYLIRVWRPHPRRAWEADSPTRSSLPVLRELVGLTMHISAQVDSRLAGAGVLIIPDSVRRAFRARAGLPDTDEVGDDDPFIESLMESMITPIQDRAAASALVPLTMYVPDEAAEHIRHLTFDKPLDEEAREMREEAIRRLALGEDAPPELLLGTAGMNHWGAWLVREDVVTTHLEPPLALICDALTTEYLWPVLEALGIDHEQYVIWYDVSHLVVRPNRTQDALELHSRGVLSDESVRRETGFDTDDAPVEDSVRSILLSMVQQNPALIVDPGLDVLLAQLTALVEGGDIPPLPGDTRAGETPSGGGEEPPAGEQPPDLDGGEPTTSGNPVPPEPEAAP